MRDELSSRRNNGAIVSKGSAGMGKGAVRPIPTNVSGDRGNGAMRPFCASVFGGGGEGAMRPTPPKTFGKKERRIATGSHQCFRQ
jgi:hypothetical protein